MGRFPPDIEWLATVVRNICVSNAIGFFGLAKLSP
jgi:hypothetical protein